MSKNREKEPTHSDLITLGNESMEKHLGWYDFHWNKSTAEQTCMTLHSMEVTHSQERERERERMYHLSDSPSTGYFNESSHMKDLQCVNSKTVMSGLSPWKNLRRPKFHERSE